VAAEYAVDVGIETGLDQQYLQQLDVDPARG